MQNPRATNLKEQQDSFSLQTLADSPHQKPPASEYQGPHNTDTALNNKVGYVARYQRQRDPQQHYKVYSVDDYRKMQKEVKLGKLGPDLDSETLREKVSYRIKKVLSETCTKLHVGVWYRKISGNATFRRSRLGVADLI